MRYEDVSDITVKELINICKNTKECITLLDIEPDIVGENELFDYFKHIVEETDTIYYEEEDFIENMSSDDGSYEEEYYIEVNNKYYKLFVDIEVEWHSEWSSRCWGFDEAIFKNYVEVEIYEENNKLYLK